VKFSKALKLMRDGHRVTRRLWSRAHGRVLTLGVHNGSLEWFDYHDGSYYSREPKPTRCASVDDCDVLADDWELAPREAQRQEQAIQPIQPIPTCPMCGKLGVHKGGPLCFGCHERETKR